MRTLKRAPSFTQWLHFQIDSNDSTVRWVARTAATNSDWPKYSRTLLSFENFLSHAQPVPISRVALVHAFNAYRAFLDSGRPLPNRAKLRRRDGVVLRYVPLSSEANARLRRIAADGALPLAIVIENAILAYQG